MRALVIPLLRAAHFIPTLAVTSLSFALALPTSEATTALGIALTVFTGQLIVGWSNDLIDYSDDLGHNRQNKPLIAGLISPSTLQIALALATLAVILLTLFGPLTAFFGLLHLFAVLSAVAYNAKLKATPFSFLPYLFSFGLLPIFILGATKHDSEPWMSAVGALFGVGLHLANVFKDLEQDRESGIYGLPQILGEKLCRIGCALCFGIGSLILYWKTTSNLSLFIVIASIIFLLPIPARFAFPFAMALGVAVMAVLIGTIS